MSFGAMTSGSEPEPQSGANRMAYLLLAFTALCWGGNAVFGRLAVGEVSPMLVVFLRWLGVLLLLVAFARNDLRRDWPVLRTHLPFLATMGVLGYTVFNALFYLAAHTTTAVNIGIIQGSIPVFVLVGAFLAYGTRVTGLQVIGVLVTLTGVVTVASGGSLETLLGLTFRSGDLMMVLACFFYGSYAVGLRRRPQSSALSLFAVMAGAALLASVPLVLAEAVMGDFRAPSLQGWIVVGLITIFPSFLAQLAFIQGVAAIGPGRAGIFVNLVPIFAAFLAVVFLNEDFEFFHALALLLVLGGIYLAERKRGL